MDENFAALLGRASCEEINLIKRVDQVRNDSILEEFPNMFRGMGCLPGDYHITLDSSVTPVVHAPRRVPHAKRDKLKQELRRMENQGIIEKTPINEPADWVNSLVFVGKPEGSLRVCIDPKDLNSAIKYEHYPLPVVEEIAARCSGAKFFSTLDAEKAFYQICLDTESSKLLTLTLPLGDIAIFECLWELCQPRKYISDECSKYLKEFQE